MSYYRDKTIPLNTFLTVFQPFQRTGYFFCIRQICSHLFYISFLPISPGILLFYFFLILSLLSLLVPFLHHVYSDHRTWKGMNTCQDSFKTDHRRIMSQNRTLTMKTEKKNLKNMLKNQQNLAISK